MSGINGFSLDYSSLFNTVGSTNSYSSNYSNYNSLNQTSSSGYSYGVNNSTLTDAQIDSILSFKNAASSIQSSLASLLTRKNDGSSAFGSYKAVSSNTDALTASYNNNIGKYSSEALLARRDPGYRPSAPENLSIKTLQLAETQVNTGESLSSSGMALEKNQTYRFEINDGTKTTEISFVTEEGDTNESVQKKIAQAINDKNIGIKASVLYDGETKTNRLVLESRETGINNGEERSFTVSDKSGYDAVSKLGLNNMTQEAKNAQYYVMQNGVSEYKESRSNDIQLNDRTSAALKKTTDDYVSISFESDSSDGINSVRSLVNGFNALYEAASNGSTVHSARLATQLQGLAETYQNQLAEAGITRNENGYFVINEEQMKNAAGSGALENLFNPDDKNQNYGFAQRLQGIADTVADNPNQYVVSSARNASSSSEDFWNELNNPTLGSSYSKLYFNLMKYENMGSLFNSMF